MKDELTLAQKLRQPFDTSEVKFKPQMVKNNRCLAMAYIDARVVMERLDEAAGVENWSDDYEIVADGSVVCRLRVKFGEVWITKTDVGSPSEQPDAGDRLKAAFSDAIKRAAIKFGIGRYLYRLPNQWVDYDPQKKQIVRLPDLPNWARPEKNLPAGPELAKRLEDLAQTACKEGGFVYAEWLAGALKKYKYRPDTPLSQVQTHDARRMLDSVNSWMAEIAKKPKGEKTPPPGQKKGEPASPKDGKELHTRMQNYEKALVEKKLCVPSAVVAHVLARGAKGGFSQSIDQWTPQQCKEAMGWALEFGSQCANPPKDKSPGKPAEQNGKPTDKPAPVTVPPDDDGEPFPGYDPPY
jgi:hypothetical protein